MASSRHFHVSIHISGGLAKIVFEEIWINEVDSPESAPKSNIFDIISNATILFVRVPIQKWASFTRFF